MSSPNATPDQTPSPSRPPSPPCSTDDIETYRSLFRRRRPPVSQPPVPCLRCAIKDSHCVYYKGDVQCQRCKRNGEEFCIYQMQDLTKPEEPLTRGQLEQLYEEDRAASRAPWYAPQQPAAARAELQLQCMVYSLDKELSQDRRRLLELATEMLEDAEGSTYVQGTPVSNSQVSNFVLPSWHSNDYQENKEDKEYCFRTATHFFYGIEETDKAKAAAGSWRLGQERRKERERLSDEMRRKREEKRKQKEAEEKARQG